MVFTDLYLKMYNTQQGLDLNLGPCGWKAEILPLRQPRRHYTPQTMAGNVISKLCYGSR